MSWFRFFKFKIMLCEPSFFGLVKIGDRIWSVLASQGKTERIFFPANFWISEWMIFLSLWFSLGWAVWKAGNSASSTNSSFTPLTNCNISPSEVSPSQHGKKCFSLPPANWDTSKRSSSIKCGSTVCWFLVPLSWSRPGCPQTKILWRELCQNRAPSSPAQVMA